MSGFINQVVFPSERSIYLRLINHKTLGIRANQSLGNLGFHGIFANHFSNKTFLEPHLRQRVIRELRGLDNQITHDSRVFYSLCDEVADALLEIAKLYRRNVVISRAVRFDPEVKEIDENISASATKATVPLPARSILKPSAQP